MSKLRIGRWGAIRAIRKTRHWMFSFLWVVLLVSYPSSAQQSASYELEESAFNSGGNPRDGSTPGSTSFLVSLDALGAGITPAILSGVSYILAGGLPAAYVPPGEVIGLLFADPETLNWIPETSAGVYNLYKGDLGAGGGGSCEQPGLPLPTSTETGAPAAGSGWFYLVTVENRLGVEGTRGTLSTGMERTGGLCP